MQASGFRLFLVFAVEIHIMFLNLLIYNCPSALTPPLALWRSDLKAPDGVSAVARHHSNVEDNQLLLDAGQAPALHLDLSVLT